jgi:ABC-type branched-subunit amino acid transport system substrate-binding protein
MKGFTRRTVLKTLGAAAATPLAAPFINLAHAQGAPIPIGIALPMTGNAGAYGPDMGEAAKRTIDMINKAGGILGGRKLQPIVEDSESSASVAANLSQKFINVHTASRWSATGARPKGCPRGPSPSRTRSC